MFIHIGDDVEIVARDLVGIFDIQSMKNSKITSEFLKAAEEEDFIFRVSQEEAKSFVVAHKDGKNIIYLSPISSATLQKRLNLTNQLSIVK